MPRHLLQIGRGIVGLGISHMRQYKWYSICSPSCLEDGCKRDDNFLTEIYSVERLVYRESADENNPIDVPEHCEHDFFWASNQFGSSWNWLIEPSPYWISTWIKEDLTLIPSDNVADINVWLYFQDFEKRFCAGIRFLQSPSMSMHWTHLKWRHRRPRNLIICSQTVTRGMCRSSFNARNKENRASSNCFKIAILASSSNGLFGRGSSPIETRRILNS
jgi:hypothetical protein